MSLFDVLREKDEQKAHEDAREVLIKKVATLFNPKEDITTYELAIILKLFAVANVDMDINAIREQAKKYQIDRHFDIEA
ncbi:hypothetical protein LP316_10455 [Thalassotalea sp. LPB0316]|uniref:hypothetical protein n=1 Tax=Thalassotalea sp. LPB0316 TaxID=2769490 RepID=UPI0018662FB6|nr:hypothetical protein [Thalassotalea sp. LPB0316]QOL24751.1 hypothetical protein LP316_10455 [Thalassotalea sp. LPB0316]